MGQQKKATGKMAYYMEMGLNFRKVMALVTKDHIKKVYFMELDSVSLLVVIFMKENGNKIKDTVMEK